MSVYWHWLDFLCAWRGHSWVDRYLSGTMRLSRISGQGKPQTCKRCGKTREN